MATYEQAKDHMSLGKEAYNQGTNLRYRIDFLGVFQSYNNISKRWEDAAWLGVVDFSQHAWRLSESLTPENEQTVSFLEAYKHMKLGGYVSPEEHPNGVYKLQNGSMRLKSTDTVGDEIWHGSLLNISELMEQRWILHDAKESALLQDIEEVIKIFIDQNDERPSFLLLGSTETKKLLSIAKGEEDYKRSDNVHKNGPILFYRFDNMMDLQVIQMPYGSHMSVTSNTLE